MTRAFWESIRLCWLAALLVPAGASASFLTPRGCLLAEDEPASTFEELRDQFEKEKSLEPFERAKTIEKFAKIPTKACVEFLAGLYAAEPNPALSTVVTQTLGRIGTEDAAKALLQKGMSYYLDPPLPQGAGADRLKALKEDMKYLIDAMGTALANRFEPKAEEWIIKNGLSPLVRKDAKATEIVLKGIARFKAKSRTAVLVNEVTKSTSPQIQIVILEALRASAAEKDDRIGSVALHFLKSPNLEVATAAYDVLAAIPGPKHRGQLMGGLKSSSWEIRVICLDALLDANDKDLVKHAAQLLKDPDARVKVSAVQALLRHGGPDVIEPLYRALETADGRLLDDLADSLARLTGKNFGTVPTQWESWWAQNKAKGENYTAMSAEEFASLKEQDTKQVTSATPLYFGLRVLSNNAAFVMDCSESMNEEYTPAKKGAEAEKDKDEGKGKTVVADSKKDSDAANKGKAKGKKKGTSRLDVAKKELLGVVQRLREGCGMNILTFNSLITDFTASAFPELKEKSALPKVSAKTREAAGAFVQAAKGEGLTNLFTALRTALEYPDIDTIYLLSDGAPTVGIIDHAELLAEMRRLNRRRKVKINCVSFHPDPSERKLLQSLADRNYGVYVEK